MPQLKVGDLVKCKDDVMAGSSWPIQCLASACKLHNGGHIYKEQMSRGEIVRILDLYVACVRWSCGCWALHARGYLDAIETVASEMRQSRYGLCEHIKCQGNRMTDVSLVDKVYYCRFHAEKARGESGVK